MTAVNDYDYELPRDLIAQHPLANRSDARLLVVNRRTGVITHSHVRDLLEFLRAGDTFVLNNTKVLPARLVGFRTRSGGRWQGLYLDSDNHGVWRILSKTRGKLETGETITLVDRVLRPLFELKLVASLGNGQWAAKPAKPGATRDLLYRAGRVPLPPYIRDGEMVDADVDAYQTVYAETPGSVAAPTAGLHLTQKLLQEIASARINIARVTLHVGLGTFRPVTVDQLEDHTMHSEWGEMSAATAATLRETRPSGGRVIAVGTTTVRLLETASRHATDDRGGFAAWCGETDLFIRPPFSFQAIDGLLTNFHLPRSTLLVLVRTFGGDTLIRRAYDEAVAEGYRFFSYGDAMLIL